MIRSQIYQDLQTLGNINESEIDTMVDHALEILQKANRLQRKGKGLTHFMDSEMERNNFAKPEDFMKIRLNFYNRYGEMGQSIRDKIVKEKWDKIKEMTKARRATKKKQKNFKKRNSHVPTRKFKKKPRKHNPRNRGSVVSMASNSEGTLF